MDVLSGRTLDGDSNVTSTPQGKVLALKHQLYVLKARATLCLRLCLTLAHSRSGVHGFDSRVTLSRTRLQISPA